MSCGVYDAKDTGNPIAHMEDIPRVGDTIEIAWLRHGEITNTRHIVTNVVWQAMRRMDADCAFQGKA